MKKEAKQLPFFESCCLDQDLCKGIYFLTTNIKAMCFSAEASFGASAVLFSIGGACFNRAANTPQKVLAIIPVVFAIQQFVEGILWLGLSHPGPGDWSPAATYIFLVFAQVVWPVLVPLAIMLNEKNKSRKKILKMFLAAGVLVSAVLGYGLLFYKVTANVSCSHIVYDVEYPVHLPYFSVLYFLASVIPPMLSTNSKLRLLGIAIFISYLITYFFYREYLISVWCYFAALISIVILFVINELNKKTKTTVKTAIA